ncbi:MAG: AtpZ/AtpI family protein [Patescibacteria group bacterium]|nr:AtpZ/AtpI family protein [Patescibacteria group bacterium]
MKYKERQSYDISLSHEGIQKTPRENKEKVNQYSLWFYLGMFGNIGFTIAFPIVFGALLGSMIDSNQGSKPAFTLIGILLGFLISIIGFLRMIQRIIQGDYR